MVEIFAPVIFRNAGSVELSILKSYQRLVDPEKGKLADPSLDDATVEKLSDEAMKTGRRLRYSPQHIAGEIQLALISRNVKLAG